MGDQSSHAEPPLGVLVLEEVAKWDGLGTAEEIEQLLEMVKADSDRGRRPCP